MQTPSVNPESHRGANADCAERDCSSTAARTTLEPMVHPPATARATAPRIPLCRVLCRVLCRALLALAMAVGGLACAPDRGPPSPRGVTAEQPTPRPRPAPPTVEPAPDLPPGPWPAEPPPDLDPNGPDQPHPLDPAPLPAPWPVGTPIAGVDFERTVIADEAVVGLASTDRGVVVATASGGLFALDPPAGFVPQPTTLPPLRGLVGGGSALIACPADGAPARIDLGDGWARLDVGCMPDGRRTVAVDKEHGYLLAHTADGPELRDGAWPVLPRRRPAPIARPLAIGAGAGRVIVAGPDTVAASDDAGATFVVGRRADPPGVQTPRDIALTGKGRAVMVGEGDGGLAIEYSRDGGRTWHAAEGPARLGHDLAAVATDARGIFYAAPRVPGTALRSDDGGRTWRALALREAVGAALLPTASGALVGAPRGLLAGLDRVAPRGPRLDRPLWRAVFTHPRIGVGVGVLGGLWRTVDGGGRWFPVPGTAGLPFTDLDRVAGHTVVAVGMGLFRRTDDAGTRWSIAPPPGSCEARWVRFAGERGLADCRDGEPAISADGGVAWQRTDAAPLRGPAVWIGADAATLTADGRLGWCRAGVDCRWSEAPADFVELAPAPEGVSAIDRDGRIWRSAGPDGRWQPGPQSDVVEPVAHVPLADGRALVVDADGLSVIDADGLTRRIGPAPGARALVVPGDGAVLVLQDGATTRFAPR